MASERNFDLAARSKERAQEAREAKPGNDQRTLVAQELSNEIHNHYGMIYLNYLIKACNHHRSPRQKRPGAVH